MARSAGTGAPDHPADETPNAAAPCCLPISDVRPLEIARPRFKEAIIKAVLFASAAFSVVITAAIIVILIEETFLFFSADDVSVLGFLFGTEWTPLFQPRRYGVLPLVCGTMHIVIGSAIVALPVGLVCGIYLSEYASPRLRSIIKPILEILAGIPTVVYGYFALTFVTPLLQSIWSGVEVFNSMSASLVVGIMILPLVASLCDDAIRSIPPALKEGAYALGATKLEVILRVIVPAALSGILASFMLAISRAVGETMIVVVAAGSTPRITADPFGSIQTMTAYIVQVSLGDTPAGTVEYYTLFAVAGLLFLITLIMNIISNRILLRYRETYE
ncbi:MAG: phosphate ABC transporter permease subunit PstC [Planctomycetota bacterium]